MKKTVISLILSVVVMAGIMVCTSSAIAVETAPDVRVNGRIVEFPDQKPFIKEGRTYIPVRFVAEALDADVSWSNEIQGAVIKQDGLELRLPIGSKTMTVIKDGKTSTVTMDAAAIKENGRTLVPIRFVAEAMGAWVSYSPYYSTVQIYKDVLTPAEINELHSLSMKYSTEGKKNMCAGNAMYENLNECLLRDMKPVMPVTIRNDYDGTVYVDKADGASDVVDLYELDASYIRQSLSTLWTLENYGVHANFRTDMSCLFSSPVREVSGALINYGYLTLTVDKDADVATYKRYLNSSKFGNIQPGHTYTYIIETVWLNEANSQMPLRMGTLDRTNGAYIRW